MARNLMLISVVLWGLLFMVGFTISVPGLGLAPLFGLYPGWLSSANPALVKLWCVLAGVVFTVLGFVAVGYRSVRASVAFLTLFVISIIAVVYRLKEAVKDFQ